MSASDQPTPAPNRRLRIALIVSLAVNFLFVGALVGLVAVGAGRRAEGGGPGLRSIGLGPFVGALEARDRRELGARLRDSRDRFAQDGRPLGRAVRDLAHALRAEPFDRDAAAAALAEQRVRGAALQETGHGLLLDQIEAMTPQARADLADRIEDGLRRSLSRMGGGGEGRGPRDGDDADRDEP